jgi:dTDP-4-amino-4,6-dideoxygalactose transaminase
MIPFSPPYISDEAINEVVEVLRSGWITTGPKTKLFEERLAEFCGNKATLCVNSATFGLEHILRWYGVKPDDEVIVPAYTYCASANVITHLGAKPILVDVNADDFNISIQKIKKAITNKTKVIIPVDIGGLPANYDEIYKIINSAEIRQKFIPHTAEQEKLGRILILSDAAHSLGGIYKSKKTGSIADVSVFSFHAVKNLTTAEGGAIALNLPEQFDNQKIYQELKILALHGQTKDAFTKTKGGNWRYDVISAGYKGNMTDIQAALGLAALKKYENEALTKRRQIVEYYTKVLKKKAWAQLPILYDENRTSSFHLFMLRIKDIDENKRDKIIESITKKEVAVNVHFQPLPMLTAYKTAGYKIEDYPVAYDNYSREISLPVYQGLTDEQAEIVIKALISSVENV